MTGAELEPVTRPTPLLPLDPSEARGVMAAYRELCRAILTDDDTQQIDDRSFVKRSGFQKLAVAYGVSTEIRSLHVDRDDDDAPLRARAVVRATHPNGRHAEGDGACARTERGRRRSEKPDHDLTATAVTRATNRAISNLVAFGAISAEEATPDDDAGVGVDPAPLPPWAQPAPDELLVATVDAITRVMRAVGDDAPAERVKALGQVIRDGCGGFIPIGVAVAITTLGDFAAPPDAETAPDPPESAAAATGDPDAGATASQPTTA